MKLTKRSYSPSLISILFTCFLAITSSNATETDIKQVFVSATWLNQLIEQKDQTKPHYIILEAYGKTDEDYKKGHIPGSIHISTNEIETEANQWNILPAPEIEKVLLSKGITQDTLLIIYYHDDIRAATRIAFTALWAGVKDVRVLNGGFKTWQKAGFPIETKENKPIATTDFGTQIPAHPEYLLATPQDVLNAQKTLTFA